MKNKEYDMERKIGLLYELSHCKGMIESILCYHWSEGMTAEDFIDDKYLAEYVEKLGKNVVMQALQDAIDHIDKINHDVFTDSEGCSYNNISFKDGYLSEKDMTQVLLDLWDDALNVNK